MTSLVSCDSKKSGTESETETKVETGTESATEAETESATETEAQSGTQTEAQTEAESKGGCGSALFLSGMALMATVAAGAFFALKKKREESAAQ